MIRIFKPKEPQNTCPPIKQFVLTEKIINEGQKDGTVREGDPLSLSVAYWAAIQGICQIIILNPALPIPDYHWVVDMVKKGGI